MVISFVSHSVALFALFSVLWSQGSGFPAEGSDPGSRTRRNAENPLATVVKNALSEMTANEFLESVIGISNSPELSADVVAEFMEALNHRSNRTRRHTDGLFTSEYTKLLAKLSARKYLESLIGGDTQRTPRSTEVNDALSKMAANEFLESVIRISNSPELSADVVAEFMEALNHRSNRTRRHTDGLFTSEYTKLLAKLSARKYLESLIGGDTQRTPRSTEVNDALSKMAANEFLESVIRISNSPELSADVVAEFMEALNHRSNSDEEPDNPAGTEPVDED